MHPSFAESRKIPSGYFRKHSGGLYASEPEQTAERTSEFSAGAFSFQKQAIKSVGFSNAVTRKPQ